MKNSPHTMLAEMLEAPRPHLSTCVLNLPYRGPSQTFKSLQAKPPLRSRRMLDLLFCETSLDEVIIEKAPRNIRSLSYFAFSF